MPSGKVLSRRSFTRVHPSLRVFYLLLTTSSHTYRLFSRDFRMLSVREWRSVRNSITLANEPFPTFLTYRV